MERTTAPILDRASATYPILTEESAVLVEARSSIGTLTFATTSVTGHFQGAVRDGQIVADKVGETVLVLPVESLSSGNSLYDAELRNRIDARQYPKIAARLRIAEPLGLGSYLVTGDLTIHGTTRPQSGTLNVDIDQVMPTAGGPEQPALRISAYGSLVVDIRDFDIALPSVLMLQIYPEVTVSFRATVHSANSQ